MDALLYFLLSIFDSIGEDTATAGIGYSMTKAPPFFGLGCMGYGETTELTHLTHISPELTSWGILRTGIIMLTAMSSSTWVVWTLIGYELRL